jgi:hypothetical protein
VRTINQYAANVVDEREAQQNNRTQPRWIADGFYLKEAMKGD